MRITHYIQDNKTSRYPCDFVFFDNETNPTVNVNGDIEQPFKLGVALYWRRRDDQEADTLEYLRFTNIAKFWKFVDKHCLDKRRLILVAHNLQFDFMVLGGFGYLRRLGFELTKLISNGKTNIFTYRNNNRSILCIDNMNYFPVALKSLGEAVGLPKLPVPAKRADINEWYAYCQRDVDVMYHAWQYWLSFLRDEDLGTFGKTITSQAFNAFRHRFMEHRILVKNNKPATELERASYRGGRVECFQLGKLARRDYYLLDINSMYPHCMKMFKYPTRQLYIKENPSISFLKRVLKNKCCIADCLVTVDKPMFGIKHKNRLIFPIGTFRATLTTQELTRALLSGSIIKIYRLSVYHCENIFTSFVDYFYNQRVAFQKDNKKVYAYLCKKLLNHLYGKFGQHNEEWVFVRKEPEPVDYVEVEIDAQTGKRYVVRCISGQVTKTQGLVEGYHSFAAISSEVTANARLMLWDTIEKAGRENVFYCDTDSVLVNKTGYTRLKGDIDRIELGKLKLVQKTQYITLHNVKDYKLGRRTKIKGISKTAKKVSSDEFITYQQQGIRSALRNKNINTMTWKRVPKKLTRLYEKGIVTHDTKVSPILMMHDFDTNWLDYENMSMLYGEYATHRGKYLDDIMNSTRVVDVSDVTHLEDYYPADQRQKVIDDQDARRAGKMIYQKH
ncbi:hypothetical protein ES703_49786 [subsurface metagenome]